MQPFEDVCELCQKHGKKSALFTYQINFQEAVTLCQNPDCSYPFGLERCKDFIQTRGLSSVSNIPHEAQKQAGRSSASLSQSSSTSLGSRQSRRSLGSKQTAKKSNGLSALEKQGQVGACKNQALVSKENVQLQKVVGSSSSLTSSISHVSISSQESKTVLVKQEPLAYSRNNCDTMLNGVSCLNGRKGKNTNEDEQTWTSLHENGKASTTVGEFRLQKLNSKSFKVENQSQFDSFNFGQNSQSKKNSSYSHQAHLASAKTTNKFIPNITCVETFLQWRNQDALCWLDVLLCLLVHNKTVPRFLNEATSVDSVIKTLLRAHEQAQLLLQRDHAMKSTQKSLAAGSQVLETISSCVPTGNRISPETKVLRNHSPQFARQTGAGSVAMVASNGSFERLTGVSGTAENETEAHCMLDSVRERIWNLLKPKLRCEKGRNDSPVFAFPILIRVDQQVEKLFMMKCRFQTSCEACSYFELSNTETLMPSLPKMVEGFSIVKPSHCRSCPKCGSKNARRSLIYERLPETFLMHFIDGLPDGHLSQLDFGSDHGQYTVTGLVQYTQNPDHFIAWLRNTEDGRWMVCDDLKTSICSYTEESPNIPGSEVHIVMWERKANSSTNVISAGIVNRNLISVQKGIRVNGINGSSSTSNLLPDCRRKVIMKMNSFSSDPGEKSPCSSLSSECSDLSDLCELPQFTTVTSATSNLVKPVACRRSQSDTKGDNSSIIGLAVDSNSLAAGQTNVPTTTSSSVPVLLPSTVFCVPNKVAVPTNPNKTSCRLTGQSSVVQTNLNGGVKVKSRTSVVQTGKSKASDKKVAVATQGNGALSKCNTPLKSTVDSSSTLNGAHLPAGLPASLTSNKALMDVLKNNNVSLVSKSNGVFVLKVLSPTKTHKDATKNATQTAAKPVVVSAPKSKAVCSSGNSALSSQSVASCQSMQKGKNADALNGTSSFKTPTSKITVIKRARVPLIYKTTAKPNVSRDAFMTLASLKRGSQAVDKVIKKPSTTLTNQVEAAKSRGAPTAYGNLDLLTSVKQYLLNKTTQGTKSKFEGINLSTDKKSTGNYGNGFQSASVPETARQSAHSSIDGRHESPPTSVKSDSVLTGKRRVLKNSNIVPLNLTERMKQPILGPTSRSVSEKRKSYPYSSAEGREKKIIRTRAPLQACSIEKQNILNTEKNNLENNKGLALSTENNAPTISKETQSKSTNSIPAEPDGCAILQDLYEALNIPFSEMESTMADVGDDFLDMLQGDTVMPPSESSQNLTATDTIVTNSC